MMARFLSFWRNLLWRDRIECDLDEEMRATFELLVDEKTRSGMSLSDARRAAAIELRLESIKEQVRDVRAGSFVETCLQDVRYAARLLRRNPLFTLTALASLATGIGSNAAVFSVVNAVLLRDLRLPRPEELAVIWKGPVGGEPDSGVSPGHVRELGGRIQSGTIAPFTMTQFSVRDDTDGERVAAMRVAWNFFSTLGVEPDVGRGFVRADDESGAEAVVVVSHGLWQRRFAGDPGLVGRRVMLGGEPHLVIGIMPPNFRFPEVFARVLTTLRPEIWTPLRFSNREAGDRGARYMFALMRRQATMPWSAVQAELDAVSSTLAVQEPRAYAGQHLTALSMHEQVVGNVRLVLLVLWGAVTCVLLAACANVGHLVLSRASVRARELAIRASVGATRMRLIRQLAVEGVVLGCGGAALGVAMASVIVRVWRSSGALNLLPRAEEIAIDLSVFVFIAAATIVTSALCGLLPALWLVRATPGVRQSRTTSLAHSRLRAALTVGQIAAALVLTAGAGLLIRSLDAVRRVDLGFQADGLQTFDISLPAHYTRERAVVFFDSLRERLSGLPNVSKSGAVSLLPLGGSGSFTWPFLVRERPSSETRVSEVRMVTPGALEALGVSIRRGRPFLDYDTARSVPVAIVSEGLAREAWPGQDPIGQQVRLAGSIDMLPWMTVIGVAADVRFGAPDRPAPLAIYRPYTQHWRSDMTVVLRASGDPPSWLASVRQQIADLDPQLGPMNVREFSHYLAQSTAQRRSFMTLLSAFAIVTLVLALTGVYGVLAYVVTLRTPEIGVRVALGASRASVLWTVMRPALTFTIAGVLSGLAATAMARGLLAQQLYSVTPWDPLTLGVVVLLVTSTALTASVLPARRAMRITASDALRSE
jgi:putative ABC transport system permease protein